MIFTLLDLKIYRDWCIVISICYEVHPRAVVSSFKKVVNFFSVSQQQAENHEAEVFKVGRRPIVRSTSLILDSSAKREPLKSANPIPVPAAAPQSKTTANSPFSLLAKVNIYVTVGFKNTHQDHKKTMVVDVKYYQLQVTTYQ